MAKDMTKLVEFLLNYGWAILVIILCFAVLHYFYVNPHNENDFKDNKTIDYTNCIDYCFLLNLSCYHNGIFNDKFICEQNIIINNHTFKKLNTYRK